MKPTIIRSEELGEKDIITHAITQWKKGRKLGKLLYTKREELYG